jgi:hypothetical protein
MAQILLKDAFWDAIYETFFRMGEFWNFLDLKKNKNLSKSVGRRGIEDRKLKFGMNMLCALLVKT